MKKLSASLLLLISGLIGALLFCEIILHVFDLPKNSNLYYRFANPELHRKEFVFNKYLFWEARPYGEAYGRKVNNKGFRGEDFEEQKGVNTIRVILLGDSCTFQAEVEDQKTGAYLLQRMLEKNFPNKNIQVLNMGMPGYSSLQGLRLLKMKALKYSPDILLVSYGHNDAVSSMYFTDKEQVANEVEYFFGKIFSNVRYYRAIRDACLKALSLFELNGYGLRPRVSLREYYNNMAEICRTAKENNIKIILYDLPVLKTPTNGKYCAFKEKYFDELRDVAKDNSVPFLNVRQTFSSLHDMSTYFNDPKRDFMHLNDKGYELVADVLYPAVAKFVVEIESSSRA